MAPDLAHVDRRLLSMRRRSYGRPSELGRGEAGLEGDKVRVGALVHVPVAEEVVGGGASGQRFEGGVQGVVQRHVELFVVQLVQGFDAVILGGVAVLGWWPGCAAWRVWGGVHVDSERGWPFGVVGGGTLVLLGYANRLEAACRVGITAATWQERALCRSHDRPRNFGGLVDHFVVTWGLGSGQFPVLDWS
uniref:(northern house mosquito) hypothetical protein n=1 Tax=Culex pipiens TaxID=7175 RepID=A0A8D8DB28_CULPI